MKLFKTKDPNLWQSKKKDINNNIMNNFELAKKHMLPKETQEIKVLSEINNYLMKHVIVEAFYFFKREKNHFRSNMLQLSDKMKRSFNHQDLIWNKFTA